jgi:hypothetical protein
MTDLEHLELLFCCDGDERLFLNNVFLVRKFGVIVMDVRVMSVCSSNPSDWWPRKQHE